MPLKRLINLSSTPSRTIVNSLTKHEKGTLL